MKTVSPCPYENIFGMMSDPDLPNAGQAAATAGSVNRMFFTPAEFKGFHTHLMYEEMFFHHYPNYFLDYTLSMNVGIDLAKACDMIRGVFIENFGGEDHIIWEGASESLAVNGEEGRGDREMLIALKGGVMVHIQDLKRYSLVQFFLADKKQMEIAKTVMDALIAEFPRGELDHTDNFYMVTHDGRSLDLVQFEINKKKFHTFDLEASYNDDFLPVAQRVEDFVNANQESGIVLLHGVPGSGKTTFIRYLLTRCGTKRIIYLPPDLAHELSSPSFFNFIRQYENSVLLIEDAENILRTREGGGNQSISNLLNMSDGIMGDALNIQLVCTFNAEWTDIDEALKRPGRLIASYRFEKLTAAKTKALCKKLHGEDVVPLEREMTLAEIYKMFEDKHKVEKKAKPAMGFAPR